jgi:PAS domain S-box-containing protein
MSRIRIPPRLPFPRETRIERSMIEKPLQDIHVSADVPARADARLRALTENALEIITVQDPSGVFTYVNEAVKRHLGYTAAELLGRNPSEFIHPDDLAAMRERFRSVRAAQGANRAARTASSTDSSTAMARGAGSRASRSTRSRTRSSAASSRIRATSIGARPPRESSRSTRLVIARSPICRRARCTSTT